MSSASEVSRRLYKHFGKIHDDLVHINARLVHVADYNEAKLNAGKIMMLDEVFEVLDEITRSVNDTDDEPTL